MSEKTIKMMTVVDGVETSIGRCHPGQARLLMKKGIAEWRDGKVWLKEPVPEKQETATEQPPFIQPPFIHEPHPAPEKCFPLAGNAISEWLKEEIARIDPDGVFSHRDPPVTTITATSFQAWCLSLLERKAAGHHLEDHDDPMARIIGFIDAADNTLVQISLSRIREAEPEVWDLLGENARKKFGSPIEREELITGEPYVEPTWTEETLQALEDLFKPDLEIPSSKRISCLITDPSSKTISYLPLENKSVLFKAWNTKYHWHHPGFAAIPWISPENEILPVYRDGVLTPPITATQVGDEILTCYFLRIGDRLFRYFEDKWWDESILQEEDYTYKQVYQSPDRGTLQAMKERIQIFLSTLPQDNVLANVLRKQIHPVGP